MSTFTPEEAQRRAREYRREEVIPFSRKIISQYTPETQPLGFWVLDIQGVVDAIARWTKVLPSVKPCFAVKCNPEPHLVKLLGDLGCGFDCATINEIKEVIQLGLPVEDITFSQTVKPYDQLIEAYTLGVKHTIVDSVEEIQKIAKYAPKMGIMVRILENDKSAGYTFGDKFGVYEDEIEGLIEEIKKYDLKFDGIHFHVGSGLQNPEVFRRALAKTKRSFDFAKGLGLAPYLVDIGGGFMQDGPFEDCGTVIEAMIKELDFPENCVFVGEPGRYLAANSFHLFTSIHGRRIRTRDGVTIHEYTCGDGIHGNFANITLFKKLRYCECATQDNVSTVYKSKIYGCSCDGSDVISDSDLPLMESGKDWIIFPNNGAYTLSLATNFNGFECKNLKVYIMPASDRSDVIIPQEIEEKSIPALNAFVEHAKE